MPGSEYYDDKECIYCGASYDYDTTHVCREKETHLARMKVASKYRLLIYKALEEFGDQPLTLGVKTKNGWARLGNQGGDTSE